MISDYHFGQLKVLLNGDSTIDTVYSFMIRFLNDLEFIEDEDIKKMLYETRNNPVSSYSLFPFLYKIFGVDYRAYYLYMLREVWKINRTLTYVNDFKRFHLYFYDKDFEIIKENFVPLKKIRINLIVDGAKQVDNFIFFSRDGTKNHKYHPLSYSDWSSFEQDFKKNAY